MSEVTIAYVQSHGEEFPLMAGIPIPFHNKHFQGSIMFIHRDRGSKGASLRRQGCFVDNVQLLQWEVQVQGRFLTLPTDGLSCGTDLPKMPFALDLIVKSMLGTSLHRQQGNVDLVSAPVMEGARLYRSSKPITLPIAHPDSSGTWEWVGDYVSGEWHSLPWRQALYDKQHYYAFSFSSPHIDWKLWKATEVPGLGSFDLGKLWGNQGCNIKMFDNSGTSFVEVTFLQPCAREYEKSKLMDDIDDFVPFCDTSTLGGSELGSILASEASWFGCDDWELRSSVNTAHDQIDQPNYVQSPACSRLKVLVDL